MTKAQDRMYNNWRNATSTELWQVYGSYSTAKAESYEEIKRECQSLGGKCLRITTHSRNDYTAAYIIENEDGTKDLVYHTRTDRKQFRVEEA